MREAVIDIDVRWEQLRTAFRAELDERVKGLNQALLRLEDRSTDEQASAEAFGALFREAHSLKGAARAIELTHVERLAHALESTLEVARSRRSRPSEHWFATMFRVADAFASLVVDSSGLDDLEVALESANAQPAPESPKADQGLVPETWSPTHVAAAAPSVAGSDSVRVGIAKLDALLAQAGELTVTHIRIQQRQSDLGKLRQHLGQSRREERAARVLRAALTSAGPGQDRHRTPTRRDLEAVFRAAERAAERVQTALQLVDDLGAQLKHDSAQLGIVTRAIEDDVMSIRLVPVVSLFGSFERMVRDIAHTTGKQVGFVIEGDATEIDRKILEKLRDPLIHMLRNAVDHGIERPDQRAALNKPVTGSLRLTAAQRGGIVQVELEDDGAGLDPTLLRSHALRKGLLTEDQAAALNDALATELIFRPGFSTSPAVTETSGRGVGMDVVRDNVERLGGHVLVSSVPGQGTRFVLQVPLTLATTRAILAEQGGQLFAIPTSMVERSSRIRSSALTVVEGRRAAVVNGHALPMVELGDLLDRPTGAVPASRADEWKAYFVLRQADVRVGILVDRLIGEQELVVKRLGWPLNEVHNVDGGAVLGSGETVVILSPSDMIKSAWNLVQSDARATTAPVATPEHRKLRLLVVDDSLTTRTLQRSIFEAAGYDVSVAADGVEAMSQLQATDMDAVVSDVEMPRLDGFGLTAEIRRDQRLKALPVVLVTSLTTPGDRERGMAAGADAYIMKSGFDQAQLLDTISGLIAA